MCVCVCMPVCVCVWIGRKGACIKGVNRPSAVDAQAAPVVRHHEEVLVHGLAETSAV